MVHFLIDTGCTNTTLLEDDIIRLNINWINLQEDDPVEIAQGTATPRLLENIELLLPVKQGFLNLFNGWVSIQYNHEHPLHIMPPRGTGPYIPRNPSHSLLGMDVLINFPFWRFSKENLLLER